MKIKNKITKKILLGLCILGVNYSFAMNGPGGGQVGQGGPQNGEPPSEAITACENKKVDDKCTMQTPRGSLSGTCQNTPDDKYFACMPDDMRRGESSQSSSDTSRYSSSTQRAYVD
ncbi:MAG: hypothetical protein PQJ44_05725 [Sphaerochaetaceae bacterium]|nr:hypothetical protein [Sphaerochaetaceae bacterium]